MEVCLQTSIFAPLFNRKHISLDYGVMVAQQVLVLFVQVHLTGCKICFVSCLKSTGIDELMTVLTGKFKTLTQNEENEDPIIVSDRVKEILEKDVLYGIDQFLQIQDDMHDIVIATEHLRYVIDGIGKITGEVIGLEEVLDVVFSKFCVGK